MILPEVGVGLGVMWGQTGKRQCWQHCSALAGLAPWQRCSPGLRSAAGHDTSPAVLETLWPLHQGAASLYLLRSRTDAPVCVPLLRGTAMLQGQEEARSCGFP